MRIYGENYLQECTEDVTFKNGDQYVLISREEWEEACKILNSKPLTTIDEMETYHKSLCKEKIQRFPRIKLKRLK